MFIAFALMLAVDDFETPVAQVDPGGVESVLVKVTSFKLFVDKL
ncbi:hypothetical protein [Thalassoglobus polymorphus]|nr:hypothetical protein [Thalassoglobus polymorphus]